MKTETLTATLMALLLGGWAWAGSEDTNQAPPSLRLELALTDGSRIIGIPKIESVRVQTDYARMEIPLKHVMAVKMDDNHGRASVSLLNGDGLKGVVSLEPIELTTLFGTVKIGIERVKSISVYRASGSGADAFGTGLVLHYTFDRDEGGSVTDRSGTSDKGAVRGAQWTSQGKSGGAYMFDGNDDHIDASVKGLEPGTKELSVACWIKAARMTPCAGLVCDRYQPLSLHALRGLVLGRDGPYQPVCYVPGGAVAAPDEAMKPGEWAHLAGVWKAGATLRVYVNGKLASAEDERVPGPTTYQSGKWKIGWDEDQSTRRFNGVIDEVMIWDRALSDAEVRQLCESQK